MTERVKAKVISIQRGLYKSGSAYIFSPRFLRDIASQSLVFSSDSLKLKNAYQYVREHNDRA